MLDWHGFVFGRHYSELYQIIMLQCRIRPLIPASPGGDEQASPTLRSLCGLDAGLAEAMAPQLSKFGISVSLVEPGPVSTPFMENIDKNTAAGKESAAKEPSDDYT